MRPTLGGTPMWFDWGLKGLQIHSRIDGLESLAHAEPTDKQV